MIIKIVEMYHGSHLYGTASASSDVDIKGVELANARDVLLGRIPKVIEESLPGKAEGQKNAPGDIDRTIFSLHHFIHLALKGETVAIDMLHAPRSAIIKEQGFFWAGLVRNRARFYTRKMTSLVGYARHQAAKYGLKGSRLEAAKRAMASLGSQGWVTLRDRFPKLHLGEHCTWHLATSEHNGLALYEVCGMKFQETATVSYVLDRLSEFVNRYGARAKQAEANQGVDWKAISHAFRAAYQMRAILTEGGFTYPLVETHKIVQIKNGEVPYSYAGPQLEALIDEVEALAARSTLPDVPDKQWAEDFLASATEWSIV